MRLKLLFFWLLSGFIACDALSGQDSSRFEVRSFSRSDYHSENQNWSIALDQSGYVYGANNVGLIEYDGVEWNYHPSPGRTVIRSVAVDSNNRIYTSGYREIGYWERNLLGELTYHSLNSQAEPLFTRNEEFWNTVIIGERIYFHSFSSVFIYENNRFRVVRTGDLIHSISRIGDTLVMHLEGQGLFSLRDTLPEPMATQGVLREDIVHFCIRMPDGGMLIGTESNGMFLFRNGILEPYLEEWRGYFSENRINRGMLTGDQRLVIGTLLDGVSVFSTGGGLLHHINTDNGIQNNTVLGMCGDGSGNLWLALDRGVDFVSFDVDPSYTLFPVEEAGAIYSAVIYQNQLYLCTNQGVFHREWEDQDALFRIVPGTQGQAWGGYQYNGQLIVGHNNGTLRIEDQQASWLSEVGGGFSLVRHPFREEVLIQSTYSDIVIYENTTGSWRYSSQLEGFSDLIRYIEPDHLYNLWASHMHRGIFRIKTDDFRSVEAVDYYGREVFGKDTDIQVFNIENRIIFTTGERIYTYDALNDSIVPFDALNRKLGEYAEAHRIVKGPDHHYWFISPSLIGLFHMLDSDIEKIREFPAALFGEHLVAGYENIFPLDARTGILCLDNGYALLRADQPDLSRLIEDRELLLRAIKVSDRSGESTRLPISERTIRVPFRKNSITMEFGFPLYSTEDLVFQSYVEGLDQDWSEPRESPRFQFTRIPSGEYRIRIRASNAWNRYSRESEIRLVVSRPWYLGTISAVLYVLLLIGMILVSRSILVRRIRTREKEIRESKERELIRLRNEKLQAELAHQSKELANATMAMIKKNEFLMELKENLKRQKEELGTRYPDKYHSALIRKIDRNISSMDDWNVFEFHFEQAHEKFLQRLRSRYPQLSQSDLRLCAYLRMNLSSKEIAPLLRISYRGVENHRYRLRKKFSLEKEANLTEFILSI